MERLLCIVGNMNAGGAETFLMKIYRTLNINKYQMDFCVAEKKKGYYEDEILKRGGKIFRITPKSKGIIKNFFDIKNIVKNNNYKYVLRVSQHSLSALELLAAKLGGAKVLAYRSSNSSSGGSKVNLCLHYIFRPFANLISNVKIAPSTKAAQYMFGNKYVKNNKVYFLHNAIDFNYYKYNEKQRNEVRKSLKLDNKFVIGHVGRLTKQKNHIFLLNLFKEIVKENNNAILLIIGNGELKEEMKNNIDYLNIKKNVIMLETQKDISKYYSAMDVFVFPSLFEGMPNTVIEAQANGLPCVISDTITKEVKLINNLQFVSLNSSYDEWINKIENSKRSKDNIENIFSKNGYDIKEIIKEFENLIFKR